MPPNMISSGLGSVLGQSFYAGAPNAGTYARPSVTTGDPVPGYTGSVSGGGGLPAGIGTGRLSLGMLALIVVGLMAFAYWVKPVSF